jgi:NADH dehydrogenase [ubiquinone] 1 alpha subcomplex assembly factor 6
MTPTVKYPREKHLAPDVQAALVAEVRDGDFDRFVCTLFAPPSARSALLALLAFDLELARVRTRVREPLLGEMRLAWWRDALGDGGASAPSGHPARDALARAISAHDIPVDRLLAIVDARHRELDPRPFEGLAEIEAHAEATAGELQAVMLHVLGADRPGATRAARAAGTAWELSRHAVAAPWRGGDALSCLPVDGETGAGGTPDQTVVPLLERIEVRVAEVRALRAEIPAEARAAMLPVVLARADARRLRRRGFAAGPSGRVSRQLRLLAAVLRNRY